MGNQQLGINRRKGRNIKQGGSRKENQIDDKNMDNVGATRNPSGRLNSIANSVGETI